MLEEHFLEQDAVFRVGRVVSVDGRRVRIAVDKLKNNSHLLHRGNVVRNVSVGGYVKIAKGFAELVASVDGEHVTEDLAPSRQYGRSADRMSRELDVSLIGYLDKGVFHRGIQEMPLLDNECFILSEDEFTAIHTFVDTPERALPLGVLATEPTQPVRVDVDEIFASHVGVFGNTGSGKSYTLAKLYHELFEKFGDLPGFRGRARIVIIDFNGEYVDREPTLGGDRATSVITGHANKRSIVLSTRRDDADKLQLPSEVIGNPLFWTVLLDATEKTQAPFLARVLESDYWDRQLRHPADLLSILAEMVDRATSSTDSGVDRQTVLNLLSEVQTCLGAAPSPDLAGLMDDLRQNLHYNATTRQFYWGSWGPAYITSDHQDWKVLTSDKVRGLPLDFSQIQPGIDLIRFKIVLQYYSDIISGFSNREHLAPLIKRMETRVPDIKKLVAVSEGSPYDQPLLVVSLRDVNLAMRKVIPMLLCKHLYDSKKNDDPEGQTLLNLVIDEAHNILSFDSSRESEAWRDYRLETFEEIVKEGRKFGVFLTIASQRPHDISPTIISQLHNYFLHRLVNDLDIRAIEKAVAYLDRVSFESLPILPTGTCIVAGIAAQIPVRVMVGTLEPRYTPNSQTIQVTRTWTSPFDGTGSSPTSPIDHADKASPSPGDASDIDWSSNPPF